MNITYDTYADALYIKLRSDSCARTVKLQNHVLVDVNQDEKPIGIEILNAKELFGTTNKQQLTISIPAIA